MPAIRYEALDSEGRTTRGVVEADGLRQARGRVRELGLTVISVNTVTQETIHTGSGKLWRIRRGISTAQLSMITRQLATLLEAGLTLENSFSALIEQTDDDSLRHILAGVRSELLEGNTLAQGMGK